MNEIRAVLFDLDNTLVDFIGMKQASCKASSSHGFGRFANERLIMNGWLPLTFGWNRI